MLHIDLGKVSGDDGISPELGTSLPNAAGEASAGVATTASREDHIHPEPEGFLTEDIEQGALIFHYENGKLKSTSPNPNL